MLCSLSKFGLALNSTLLFWKCSVFKFLPGASETFLCSMSAPQVKSLLPLDSLQLLIFLGTLTYLEHKSFALIIFYNGIFLIIKI
jgi:hypothetical protein